MEKHARQQIRDVAVQVLTGLPSAGANVFSGRARPLAKGHDDTLLVYTIDELAEINASGNPAKQSRSLTLRVEGRVQTNDAEDAEDRLDTLACDVELTLLRSGAVMSLVQSIELSRTQVTVQAAGEAINGGIAMDFIAIYRTAEGAPTSVL